jgi:hypothetical protein
MDKSVKKIRLVMILKKLKGKVMEREKERLKFSIGRYDHYYDSVNNKSNVYLTLNLFIVGGLTASYTTIMDSVYGYWVIPTLLIVSMALGLLNLLIIVLASRPYLTDETDSLLFFQSVNNMELNTFKSKSEAETEAEELEDLRIQTFQLAAGLKSKFKKLYMVGNLFALQILVFIPLIILILKNLK